MSHSPFTKPLWKGMYYFITWLWWGQLVKGWGSTWWGYRGWRPLFGAIVCVFFSRACGPPLPERTVVLMLCGSDLVSQSPDVISLQPYPGPPARSPHQLTWHLGLNKRTARWPNRSPLQEKVGKKQKDIMTPFSHLTFGVDAQLGRRTACRTGGGRGGWV